MHLTPAEEDVPIEPPSATTTTTIGISATSTTFTTAFGKKRASVATTPGTNRKNKKNKTKDSPNEPIILQDPQVSTIMSLLICNVLNVHTVAFIYKETLFDEVSVCFLPLGCTSTAQGGQEQDPRRAPGWGGRSGGRQQRFGPIG